MIQDAINGSFEMLAGVAVLHHCHVLRRDGEVKGVSIPAVIFFTAWGAWNMYYYPFLGQPLSFVGGVFVTLANLLYVALLARTIGLDRIKWAVRDFLGGLICLVRGHDYKAPYFHSKCLYFCSRCNKELLGRTWDDIEPLTAEEQDDLETMDMIYADHGGAQT